MAEEESPASGAKNAFLPLLSCGGCFGISLFPILIGIVIIVSVLAFVSLGGNNASGTDEGTLPNVQGDVEFWVTYYDPSQGGVNGVDCGGAEVSVGLVTNQNSSCLSAAEREQYRNSPTGYAVKYKGRILGTGEFAVPQVNESQIPVPLVHGQADRQAKIILPGYNNNQGAVVGDHFATSITKPNRLDMLCHASKYSAVARYWNQNHLVLDTAGGFNGGSKIMGKIEGNVIR